MLIQASTQGGWSIYCTGLTSELARRLFYEISGNKITKEGKRKRNGKLSNDNTIMEWSKTCL